MDAPALPARKARGHKGDFGTVVVAGGSMVRSLEDESDPARTVMVGGVCLCGLAALRAGAGLCRLMMPDPLLMHGLMMTASATGIGVPVSRSGDVVAHQASAALDRALESASCLVVGPGLGTAAGAQALCLRAVQQERVPVVVDADGLNCLSRVPSLHEDFRCRGILTPHVGEWRRLGGSLGCDADPLCDGVRAAEQLAQRLGCVVVLKSSVTVVSDGHRSWEHDRANPVLGTAGTGDVLSGLIGGLVAQHGAGGDLFELARCGVWAHGESAARWRGERGVDGGMLAEDLLEGLPEAVGGLRTEESADS